MSLIYVPCRVCNKDSADFLFEKSGWKIVRCRNCGFIYSNPIPEKHYLETFYSSGVRIEWHKEKNPSLIEHFSSMKVKTAFGQMKKVKSSIGRILVRQMRLIRWNRYLPQEGRFLDVGCGPGYLVLAAERRKRWKCHGLDIQTHKLRYARTKYPHMLLCVGTADELCFKNETFDIVTLTHLLEHLFDPLRTLREVARVLRRKGVLVVTVPNVAHPYARLRGEKWRRINPPGHLWYFSPQTLAKLVKKADLDVIHVERLRLMSNVTIFGRKG